MVILNPELTNAAEHDAFHPHRSEPEAPPILHRETGPYPFRRIGTAGVNRSVAGAGTGVFVPSPPAQCLMYRRDYIPNLIDSDMVFSEITADDLAASRVSATASPDAGLAQSIDITASAGRHCTFQARIGSWHTVVIGHNLRSPLCPYMSVAVECVRNRQP